MNMLDKVATCSFSGRISPGYPCLRIAGIHRVHPEELRLDILYHAFPGIRNGHPETYSIRLEPVVHVGRVLGSSGDGFGIYRGIQQGCLFVRRKRKLHIAVCLVDRQHRIVSIPYHFLRCFGIELVQVVQYDLAALLYHPERERAQRLVKHLAHRHRLVVFVKEVVAKYGYGCIDRIGCSARGLGTDPCVDSRILHTGHIQCLPDDLVHADKPAQIPFQPVEHGKV